MARRLLQPWTQHVSDGDPSLIRRGSVAAAQSASMDHPWHRLRRVLFGDPPASGAGA